MKTRRLMAAGFVCVLLYAVLAAAPHAFSAQSAEEMTVLKLELPEAKFTGTRENIKAVNLEKSGTKRKKIMVPKGIENVALGKPVTSSDNEPVIGELEQVTDGDKEGADGSFVELGPDVQWVQIDLGDEYEVFAIALWHFHSKACVFHDTVVQCADDPDFIENVKTLFNNDHDNSTGLGVGKEKAYIETNKGRVIDAKGVKARYIRLYSKGSTSNDINRYTEVEVYGQPTG